MKRDLLLFVEDILKSIDNVQEFSKGLDENKFLTDKLRHSAIVRQLEILGEAVKNLPEGFRSKYNNIEWKKIAGLRDILIHAYFGIDMRRAWGIIKQELPELRKQIKEILKKEKNDE